MRLVVSALKFRHSLQCFICLNRNIPPCRSHDHTLTYPFGFLLERVQNIMVPKALKLNLVSRTLVQTLDETRVVPHPAFEISEHLSEGFLTPRLWSQ